MRTFIINDKALLDQNAYEYLRDADSGIFFPCEWMHFNDRIKLVCFPDNCTPLIELIPELSLDETCAIAKELLQKLEVAEETEEIMEENIILDADGIYLDEQRHVHLICLPVVKEKDSVSNQIFTKRIYALIEELLAGKEGADEVYRQIEFQKERQFGDWASLSDALDRRMPEEDETILIKSVNTSGNFQFRLGHEGEIRVGSDPEQADFVLAGEETVSPLHAVLGWNEISFYVIDKDSVNGTFVNNQQVAPGMEVPIGKGTVLRFADCTFSVE